MQWGNHIMLNNRETIRFVYAPLQAYSEKEKPHRKVGLYLNCKVLE